MVANLEIVLSTRGEPVRKTSTITLRSHPEHAMDLSRFAVSAVSLANNHTMDYGDDALDDTIAALDSAGVAHFGAGPTLAHALRPHIVKMNGVRVAVVGLSCTVPAGAGATDTRPGIAPIYVATSMELDPTLLAEQPGSAPRMRTRAFDESIERAQAATRYAAESADVVIAYVHWGVPPASIATFFGDLLADYQQPLGHALIDSGASAVIGHHPHAVHGIEVYKGRVIAYSLGNMAFESDASFMSTHGLLAELGVTVGGIDAVSLHPLTVRRSGLPRMPTLSEMRVAIRELKAGSEQFGTRMTVQDGVMRVELK